MTKISLALLLCCSFGPTVVAADSANDAPSMPVQAWFVIEPAFERLDCTDEGYIQATEIDEHLQDFKVSFEMSLAYHRNVRKADAEMSARLQAIKDHISKSMDADGDGAVSTLEFRAYALELFHSADTDRDGEVTPEELSVSEI